MTDSLATSRIFGIILRMKTMSFLAGAKVAALCAVAVGVPSVCRAKMPDGMQWGVTFGFYAIADGVCRLFTRHGRWNGLDGPDEEPEEPCQLELALQ